jgi:hypothetical protein
LHEGNHDAVKLSDIERVSSVLSKRINLVEQQYARGLFGKSEQLAQVNRRLSKVRSNHSVKPNNVNREAKLVSNRCSCNALPAPWRTMEEQPRAPGQQSSIEVSSVDPFRAEFLDGGAQLRA